MKQRSAETIVRLARARASFLQPYLTAAIYGLVLVESERVPTIATDQYRRLYFNPKWVEQHLVSEMATWVLHEVGHVLRDHHERAKAVGITRATMRMANWAMDCELNDDLKAEEAPNGNLAPLSDPKDPAILVLPEAFRPPAFPWKIGCEDGQIWESYYRHMLRERSDDDRDGNLLLLEGDCGSGAHGVRQTWDLGDPAGGFEGVLDADWKDIQDITANAIIEHVKMAGTVPGEWVEWAGKVLAPPFVHWDQLLTSWLRWSINDASGMVFHSYRRPSRRQSAFPDFVMPCMRRPIPFVVVIGDTSGSMDLERLAYVRGVVRNICQSLGAKLAFLATDTNVHGGVQIAHDGTDVELRGRGGTNMAAGIDYAMRYVHPKPDAIIVCTDCETPWPNKAPAIRTFVAAIGASTHGIQTIPSWATVVQVPVQEAA
jgi:predicted metal-dependent peptidase